MRYSQLLLGCLLALTFGAAVFAVRYGDPINAKIVGILWHWLPRPPGKYSDTAYGTGVLGCPKAVITAGHVNDQLGGDFSTIYFSTDPTPRWNLQHDKWPDAGYVDFTDSKSFPTFKVGGSAVQEGVTVFKIRPNLTPDLPHLGYYDPNYQYMKIINKNDFSFQPNDQKWSVGYGRDTSDADASPTDGMEKREGTLYFQYYGGGKKTDVLLEGPAHQIDVKGDSGAPLITPLTGGNPFTLAGILSADSSNPPGSKKMANVDANFFINLAYENFNAQIKNILSEYCKTDMGVFLNDEHCDPVTGLCSLDLYSNGEVIDYAQTNLPGAPGYVDFTVTDKSGGITYDSGRCSTSSLSRCGHFGEKLPLKYYPDMTVTLHANAIPFPAPPGCTSTTTFDHWSGLNGVCSGNPCIFNPQSFPVEAPINQTDDNGEAAVFRTDVSCPPGSRGPSG